MNIAIMGFGVVGRATFEAVKNTHLKVTKILDRSDFPEIKDILTFDFEDIIKSDCSIVVECIGGVEPASSFIEKLLKAGKSIVTSNKEVVALKRLYFEKLAKENGVYFFYEASVGGGIPIIRPLKTCLSVNKITEIEGILNGTTNYILTIMNNEGKSFNEALALAQEKGYAEKDPSADIEGFDTARKICILSSIAFGEEIDYSKIDRVGIKEITEADFLKAQKEGKALKLIGKGTFIDGKIEVSVKPTFIDKDNPLANVSDVYNAVLVKGDIIGSAMFYGPGAGFATASAILGDVLYIAGDGYEKRH